MPEELEAAVAARQLRRLETFTDCVYGVAIVLIITYLPEPISGDEIWLRDLFIDDFDSLIHVLIAVLFVILYWLRSNQLFGYLKATDTTHTALSIL